MGDTPLEQNIKLPQNLSIFHITVSILSPLCRAAGRMHPPSSCARGTFVPRGPPQTSQTPSSFRRTRSHFTWLCYTRRPCLWSAPREDTCSIVNTTRSSSAAMGIGGCKGYRHTQQLWNDASQSWAYRLYSYGTAWFHH